MEQGELTGIFCSRPQNFAWLLGAGASRSAGLPTATDILWDLKRHFYCREENQEISRQDIQNTAVRERIQSFIESKGFPAQFAEGEYPTYFDKLFGDNKERQRRYLKEKLSGDHVRMAVGHRVLAALIASGNTRAIFTTNFDDVVEKAVAEIAGQSLAAYHLEGAHNANAALNNEEFPLYCKLHGDFRYDSLKNLPDDLASQNKDLSDCLVNAGNRFGFIVAGYSGRDASVMELLHAVLETANPFPHGLYWTDIKGFPLLPSVTRLLESAQEKGVSAHYVPVETFDTLLLRLWRNIEGKSPELDQRVRKTQAASASIPLPGVGRKGPLIRLNALPILSMPSRCLSISFASPVEWSDLNQARNESDGGLILTKGASVYCWGDRGAISGAFGQEPTSVKEIDLPADIGGAENLYIKGFVEEALTKALAKDKPLLSRTNRSGSFLIVDPHAQAQGDLQPLFDVVGKISAEIQGLFTPVTDEHPQADKIRWAEAVRVSLDIKDGKAWLSLDPDIWIWPTRGRHVAVDFLDKRRSDRLNQKYNALLDAWVRIVLGTDERNAEIAVSAYDGGSEAENPVFRVFSRTGFVRRAAS